MPNEITNCLSVHGSKEKIEELIEFVKNGDNPFDFNKIIPMPEALDIEHKWPLSPEEASIRERNLKLYGAETWRDWCIKHWGTKWNCWSSLKYRSDPPENWVTEREIYQIEFNTAWSPPIPIFQKLAELFPELQFYSLYQDEVWLTNEWALGFGEYTEEEKKEFYGENQV